MTGEEIALPPIAGFVENTLIDWEGKLAAEVFLPGCNFRCPFCYASHLVVQPQVRETIPVEQVLASTERNRGWIDGIVISGGEPTLHATLPDLIRLFRSRKLLVKLDTNGSRPEVVSALLAEGLLAAASMDIKAPLDGDSYARATAVECEIERIQRSVELLMASGIEYEFRTTVVPTVHSMADIETIARSLAGARKYVLQQFLPMRCLDPEFQKLKPPTREFLREAAQRASRFVPCVVRGEYGGKQEIGR